MGRKNVPTGKHSLIFLVVVVSRSERSHEALHLFHGLESAVTQLGGSIDELQVDGFGEHSLAEGEESLSDGDRSLLGADDAALGHDPVVGHVAVVGEAAEGVDALLGEVGLGHAGSVVAHLSELVDSLVHLGSVVVAVLTASSDSEVHSGRVPGADTGDLSETSVRLSGQSGDAPSGDDALSAVTLGGTAGVEDFAFREDLADSDLGLEEGDAVVDLVGDVATVDLDFHDVSLLLSEVGESGHHGVADGSDDGAVLLHSLQLLLDLLRRLLVLLGVLGESLLLGSVPVSVESSSAVGVEVLGPHGGESSQTSGGLHVADQTDALHGGSLHDGDGLHGLLLVELGAGSVDLSDDVGHTRLEGDEGGEVRLLGSIVSGESSHSTSVVSGSLSGQEAQTAVSGRFKLTVRHSVK